MDRERYYWLKTVRRRASEQQTLMDYGRTGYQLQHVRPAGAVRFKHSGNAGDLIYALPTVQELAGPEGAELALVVGAPMRAAGLKHPLGGVMLNDRMITMLRPLLEAQRYVRRVVTHDGQRADYDLDVFRDAPLPQDKLQISRWYFYFFGVAPDLARPWLQVEPDRRFKDSIVIARSHRYRNNTLDYGFMRDRDDLVFIGLEDEFFDLRAKLPKLEWVPVKDFLEMARVIAGSRLFIGNQSFPFSVAEGLKVKRVLETAPDSPNVVPTGAGGFDVMFQSQFEHLLRVLAPG